MLPLPPPPPQLGGDQAAVRLPAVHHRAALGDEFHFSIQTGQIGKMGLSILEILSGALAAYTILNLIYWLNGRLSSPFAYDNRKKRKPYITDQKKRAEVLKQHFSIEKVFMEIMEF